jgi:hypothetical protein
MQSINAVIKMDFFMVRHHTSALAAESRTIALDRDCGLVREGTGIFTLQMHDGYRLPGFRIRLTFFSQAINWIFGLQ